MPGLPDFKLQRVLGQGGFGQVLALVTLTLTLTLTLALALALALTRCSKW